MNPSEEQIDKHCTEIFLTQFDHGYLIQPLKPSDLRCCSLLTLRMLGLDEASQMKLNVHTSVLDVLRTHLDA